MNTLITKTANAVSSVALFATTCVMAGLGFALVSTLVLFALIASGVALMASPFVAMAQRESDADADTSADDTTVDDAAQADLRGAEEATA